MKKFILLLLVSPLWAAVSFHAIGSFANQNGGAMTINLPTVSNNDYVLCGVTIGGSVTAISSNGLAFTTPAGYTSWIAAGPYALFGHLWKTGDGTSISVTPQNGASSWESGGCVSYSGVDTTTPVDGVANYAIWQVNSTGAGSTNNVIAPAVAPQFNADMCVQMFFDASNFGATFTTPSGFTNRGNGGGGPTVYINDKLLVSGVNTGSFNSTANGHNFHGGVQILLKGGTSATFDLQPTIAGYFTQSTPADFKLSIFPQDGDMVVYFLSGGASGLTMTGYSTVYSVNDVSLFTHTWHTGDSTNPATPACTGCGIITYIIRNYNPKGITLVSPTVDNSTTCANASGTSLTCPSSGMSLTSASDLLMVDFSSGTNSVGNTNAWTLSGSLGYVFIKLLGSGGISVAEGFIQGVSNPTGTYTSTIAGSAARLGSGVTAFKILTGPSFQPRHNGNEWVQ